MQTSPSSSSSDDNAYTCGTIVYTRRTLLTLFFWLLWGDVCFVLMEAVVPTIMPLKLKALGSSDSFIGAMLVTAPMLTTTLLNPVISYRSDRFRSRWGRRIPFILSTLPFLVVCLVGLGCGDALGLWLQHTFASLGRHFSPAVVTLGTLSVLMIVFGFFNTFVNSTFWYLFNDVVPPALLARFMSWFRMVSLGSASLYNLCVFPYAETHYREIFVGAGAVYFVGFGFMCLKVREGSYPPPPRSVDGSAGFKSAIKTFVRQCHADRLYLFLFLSSAAAACSLSITTFMLFFYQSTGLNLSQIGKIQGAISIGTAIFVLGSGWLADRFHPIRVTLAGQILQVLVVLPVSCVWIFWHPQADVAFWAWMGISVFLTAPVTALIGMSDPPLLMRLFPRETYGQFCSATAMWRALGGVVGGVGAGVFLDKLEHLTGSSRVFTFLPLWQIAFTLPVAIFTWMLFKRWRELGGDRAYQPPMPKAADVLLHNPPVPPSIPGEMTSQQNTAAVIEAARSEELDR